MSKETATAIQGDLKDLLGRLRDLQRAESSPLGFPAAFSLARYHVEAAVRALLPLCQREEDETTRSHMANAIASADGNITAALRAQNLATDEEQEAWWPCQDCTGKRWCLRSLFVCRQCLGMKPGEMALDLPPPSREEIPDERGDDRANYGAE